MRILVTGGAGFIASHVAEAYLAAGHRVAIVDNLSTGKRENLPNGADFHQVGIHDEAFERVIADFRPEVVSHHAAQASVKVSAGDIAGDLMANGGATAVHPRTGARVFSHALGQPQPAAEPAGDRRRLLAEWMTSPDNPWFAKSLANRMWAHFLGRGLIEPVDDLRETNPPSNPELLDELARTLIAAKFDVKALIRQICGSRTYQLATEVQPANSSDEQNYSRALFKRLDAEVLLDAVCDATGAPEKFAGVPSGSRAVQLWDSQVSHEFLKLFGRPTRLSVCECERTVEPTVSQVLHVLNSPGLQAKLSHAGGRISRLVATQPTNGKLLEEIYMACLSRLPEAKERQAAAAYFERAVDRQTAAEDLAWSLLNSVEFVFNH